MGRSASLSEGCPAKAGAGLQNQATPSNPVCGMGRRNKNVTLPSTNQPKGSVVEGPVTLPPGGR